MAKKTVEERIAEAIRIHPTKTPAQLARNLLGIKTEDVFNSQAWKDAGRFTPEELLRRSIAGMSTPITPITPVSADHAPHLKPGHCVADFLKANDPEKLIEAGIAKYLSKPGTYYPDAEFRELCKVHVGRWRRFADLQKYEKYRFVRGKHNNWAHPDDVEKMVSAVGLL